MFLWIFVVNSLIIFVMCLEFILEVKWGYVVYGFRIYKKFFCEGKDQNYMIVVEEVVNLVILDREFC